MPTLKRLVYLGIVAFIVALASRTPARALTIVPTFDSSVTSATNAAQIEAAFNYAAQQLDNAFSNPITLNINVVAQPGTSITGQSAAAFNGFVSYSTFRMAYAQAATTAADASALASLPISNPTDGNITFARSEAKVLGFISGNASGSDGTFTFGAGQSYTFDPANRAVPGEIDFIGVALHEVTEIMGRDSLLGLQLYGAGNGPMYVPLDLFRFDSPGVRTISSTDGSAYFSIDGGNTNLKNFNDPNNGEDAQDFATTTPYSPDPFNAFIQTGVENDLNSLDITNMDIIGFTPVPEPTTIALLSGSAILLLSIGRRRNASRP